MTAQNPDKAELLRRRKSALETLVQRTQIQPSDAELIGRLLRAETLDGLWEAALEAPAIARRQAGSAAVFQAIDSALTRSLREKRNPYVVAELYNRLPRDTVALQKTALEVTRQSVQVFEEGGRVEAHADGYLSLLNNPGTFRSLLTHVLMGEPLLLVKLNRLSEASRVTWEASRLIKR